MILHESFRPEQADRQCSVRVLWVRKRACDRHAKISPHVFMNSNLSLQILNLTMLFFHLQSTFC